MNHPDLSSVEEILDEARNGRMFILVDDEDRENEGDLVIPAQMATPDVINFMATHGRGLICLALSKERVDHLGLEPMSRHNGTRHETAFTVSIEAREGVTTGISAADRARTIAVAIDATKGRADLVTPGHVFPLIAREGGVLVRAGHTEAAVDVARLAGLNPSGVICEIMKDDGSMARLPDLIEFAKRHHLKIGTIQDLIAYRHRHDHLVHCVVETTIQSEWGGEWTAKVYLNKASGSEHVALVKGRIRPDQPVLVRMHHINPLTDAFGVVGPRRHLLSHAMRAIGEAGSGVIVTVNRSTGNLLSTMARAHADGHENGPAFNGLREHGIGAQILSDLGVHKIILLSNNQVSFVGLPGYALEIVEQRPIPV